jgi:hypothetical protein|tara:strand:- start:163 stop:414 length:252 start_codon:yes stop_codon:yes gene_type:complete
MWGECQVILVIFVDYFFLLWVGLVLVNNSGFSSVDNLGHILGFVLGLVNVFGDINTFLNNGRFFGVVYLESTAREKNRSDKSN